MQKIIIAPQPGPQTMFLSSPADIVIYGGAAFGGKTFGELLDKLRHFNNPKYRGTMFRRHITEITMPGGLMEKAREMYSPIGCRFKNASGDLRAVFPKGGSVSFKHLQHLNTIYQYQGLETDTLDFDELTHFYFEQFNYLITRARSTSGIKPRIKGTCNPDPDSWVKTFIRWWLDEEGEYADPTKAGVIRWFLVDEQTDEFIWFDSQEEIRKNYDDFTADFVAMSATFIPSLMEDNQIGMAKDPRYIGRLSMQDKVTRLRLKKGNWKIKPAAGTYFRREWFEEVEAYPELVRVVRFWDRAATEKKDKASAPTTTKKNSANDPDYTCSVKMGLTVEGRWIILGLSHAQKSAHKIEGLIKNTAVHDTTRVKVMTFQDPGAAGKGEAERFVFDMAGFDCETIPATTGKETNAKSFSAQVEAGNVKLWSKIPKAEKELFYSQLEQFPEGGHDDYVDAGSGAFNELVNTAQVGIF